MDAFEAGKTVHDRIKELEPRAAEGMTQHLTQIPKEELIRLALGPDCNILNLIQKLHNASLFIPSSSINITSYSSPPEYGNYYDSTNNMMSVSGGRKNGVINQSCRYFKRGYCKHGNNCRYYHPSGDGDEFDQVSYYGGLEKLEWEVVQLLKSQRGCPVSIASLPMMYHDKYGRSLQAEGYLSESQRHGKAGYSLTKLLARLNGIRLIDRPHGQHDVVLDEDAPMHGERSEHGPSVFRQIYLTFPPESTFSEEDVATYFSKYGAVEDVRIPWQEKRMFGFVTFASASTVKLILSKQCPHHVCGARILAKPYREKSNLAQRSKYLEKFSSGSYHPIDSSLQHKPYRVLGEDENVVERMRRLSQLQLLTRGFSTLPHNYNTYTMNNDCIDDVEEEEEKSAQGLDLRRHAWFPTYPAHGRLNLPDRPFEFP